MRRSHTFKKGNNILYDIQNNRAKTDMAEMFHAQNIPWIQPLGNKNMSISSGRLYTNQSHPGVLQSTIKL